MDDGIPAELFQILNPGLTTRWPTVVRGFSPGLSVFPSGAAVCLPKDRGVLVGVAISPLGVMVIVSDFL